MVALVVAVGVAIGRSRHVGPDDERGVLAAVPQDAWLVVTIDVAALRRSALAQPLLGGGPGAGGAVDALPGLGSLPSACGFDPVARLRQVTLASPEGGERGEFGVAFAGELTQSELTACAEKAIIARGGRPVTSARDGFTVVEDTSDAQHARVAYRDGGPFLVGRGAWLDAMMNAAVGKGARARADHEALREALAPSGSTAPRAVVLTALLPKALRKKLEGELGAEAGGDGERAYAAVLSVEAAGLALSTGGSGSTTQLAAELRCETPAACDEVKTLIERTRLSASQNLGLRLVGLGPLLDSLHVEVHGTSLSARAQAPTDDLARALQRVLALRAPFAATPSAPLPSPAASVERREVFPDGGGAPSDKFGTK